MAEKLRSRKVLRISAHRKGTGVAEMLERHTPLLQELGVDARWEVIQGGEGFQAACQALYNLLQGEEDRFTEEMFQQYVQTNRENARGLPLETDVVVIHDHQAAPLVDARPQEGRWVWRCHLDVARPQRKAWAMLRQFVVKYDAAVFSLPKFAQRLPIPQFLIYPSIDPLSEKNRELSTGEIRSTLDRLGIPADKPILLQVSRFHRFKDPVGVIEAYRIAKKQNDCRLVLAGSPAEGEAGRRILAEMELAAGGDPDVHIVQLPESAEIEINALQRAAAIVIQKSTREGFGLMVAEAMWKGKPVIGGFAGGITAQLIYEVTGYTVNSVEGCAYRIRTLLNNPDLAAKMGEDAREFARHHFLITRNLGDYLALLTTLLR
ncbi:MAG: glycosyltransferase [Deltaproteobacteria bacterium]|nr:glycosyltransferase [Deltaproteobacteria bacterium]